MRNMIEKVLQRVAVYGVIPLVMILMFQVSTKAATIDFEGLPAGTIVDEVSTGAGVTGDLNGSIGIFGFNPSFGAGKNAAVIFDSSNPTGGDVDLGTPNQDFGGPGIGAGGEAGSPFENNTPLGNILIVAEDLVDNDSDGLVDDPDDADLPGEFIDFDFSTTKNNKKGTVTVNSVTIMDVERSEFVGDAILLFRPGQPTSFISVPPQGDNGVVTIGPIGLSGVESMRLKLNGSAGIASAVVNEEEDGICWITFGGFQNAGIQSGGKDFTFGGNVGPPPSGAIEVIDHNTGDNFHSNDVQIVDCRVIEKTGPGQPGGKKGFEINQAFFEGTGRLNGVGSFPFTGFVNDAGEPSGKKNNDKDFFEIVVKDPGTGDIVFEASGELDGGNVQIHPPNPSL